MDRDDILESIEITKSKIKEVESGVSTEWDLDELQEELEDLEERLENLGGNDE